MRSIMTGKYDKFKEENYINKRYGKLLVLELVDKVQQYNNGRKAGFKYLFNCVCDCGNTCTVTLGYLKHSLNPSCGCYTSECYKHAGSKSIKHGLSHSRIYTIWVRMKERCLNKNNKNYPLYGGRGIKICEEWLNDFINFYNWAIQNDYKDNLTIDRIDVNGNYEPNNCRWADMKTQTRNRRNNRIVIYDNKSMCISQCAEENNISDKNFRQRINSGWSVEEAINRPIKQVRLRLITFNGETHSVSEWARILRISRNALRERLDKGWPLDRVLNEPKHVDMIRKKRKVKCLNNNVIYNSCREAEKELGLVKHSVSRVATGERNSIHGYYFEYVEEVEND